MYLCAEMKTQKCVWWLMAISLLVRGTAAALLELGVDEAYYWTYPLFPDLSYFDHPPLLSYLLSVFTLRLRFDGAFGLRLVSLVLGTVNTWLMYRVGTQLKNERTGLYAALLYTASVYGSVMVGTFILPDTPLSTCYLLAFLFLLRALGANANGQANPNAFLWTGLFIGLAMCSKYSGVFLWVGIALFVLLFQRRTLRTPQLWLGILVSLVTFSPVLIWNAQHGFISFLYHTNRVGIFQSGFHPFYLARELGGELFYNNPVNFVLIIWALFSFLPFARKSGQPYLPRPTFRLFLCLSLPLWGYFLFIALFRETLPHWTAPSFYPLLFLVAVALDSRALPKVSTYVPNVLKAALGFIILVFVGGVLEIKTGVIPMGTASSRDPQSPQLGRYDFTLDMYGWKQAGATFGHLCDSLEQAGKMPKDAPILTDRWFHAAQYDYYLARPNHKIVKTEGPLYQVGGYERITALRGGVIPSQPHYVIYSSRYPTETQKKDIEVLHTFYVYRCQKPVIRYTVCKYIPGAGTASLQRDGSS